MKPNDRAALCIDTKFTRRDAMRVAFACGLGACFASSLVCAETLEPLQENEPSATSMSYHIDGSTIDLKAFPEYDAFQTCSACAHFKENNGCALFPGRSVAPAGWCKVWRPQE